MAKRLSLLVLEEHVRQMIVQVRRAHEHAGRLMGEEAIAARGRAERYERELASLIEDCETIRRARQC
jgi:hypothetical protein